MRLGLIVNPLAGIGGRVGLKGSDGADTVRAAFALGAKPVAPARAVEALLALSPLRNRIELITYPGDMGEAEAREAGFVPAVIGSLPPGQSTAADTRQAAVAMAGLDVGLLLFVGGDGTARDIHAAVGDRVIALGIPAGVKIHSSVYAINPRSAARLAAAYIAGRAAVREMEVMDIDEELFRAGAVSARLYGYLKVPYEPRLVQGAKAASTGASSTAHAIAEYVVDDMSEETTYVLGPGTTVKAIADELGIDKTLLGVDVVRHRQLVARDVNEEQLLRLIAGREFRIVVTVIGGQGYIFGRGNQQISPAVIRQAGKKNIIIVASLSKLLSLNRPLLVDTGDPDCDRMLTGHVRVITGYDEESVWKVEC